MSAGVALSLGVSGYSCASPRHLGLGGGPVLRFPAGWALIEHPRHGAVLFDCGYGAAARAAMRRGLRRIYRHVIHACSAAHTDAASLLQQRGLRCADIGTVVLSHFHPDHIGGLAPFANARFVVHAEAWRQVRRGGWFGLLHAQIWKELLPADFAARLQCLDERGARALDGDLAGLGLGWDLFDDGSVAVVSLPGHARGQIGLALRTVEGERALLVADAFWRREQLQREVELPWLTRWLAVDDGAAYRDTVRKLVRFQREHPQAWVIPAHCADTLAQWRARHPQAVLDDSDPL
ncbi:MBL fold metallo-hydrolase [Lysobacter firmicutimachus]|uniref:MBL fold metallo-hydrolase n=1 Tax=Lysobacter firmicutimachus TaxID=1792846 RepID=A0AAU8MPI2_9GAMM